MGEKRTDYAPADNTTATLAGARGHARAQAGAARGGPTVPSRSATDLPVDVSAVDVFWDETIDFGGYASRTVPRGSTVRFVDVEGDACVQLFVHNLATPSERLNVADTVEVQWQAYLGPGALLLSDMGRVLMTIVGDTSVRHDCLCGVTSHATATRKYGDGRLSGPTPNGRDLLCVAAAKHGLGRVDVGPNVNLFKAAPVQPDGRLLFDGEPAPGGAVDLRAELDVLVVVANTPHPLDPRPTYEGTPARVTAWRGDPATAGDTWRNTSPERARAFENTDEWLLGVST
jgi:urea carboxylase-associated protein 2